MPGSLLGNRVRRLEDPDLLTGKGTYVGNLDIEGCARAIFIRSPFAHARIERIDTSEAERAPGVLCVLTADTIGMGKLKAYPELHPGCPRYPLAKDKVRFVGDPVALVVAETEAQAMDAAELVVIDYEPLDVAVDPEAALAIGAPLQFEELGTNLVASAIDAGWDTALEGASVIVRAQLENQRIAVVPMEGDAIAVDPRNDGRGHELTVYVSTQMPHMFYGAVQSTFGLDRDQVRIVTPHVGGGFGSKVGLQPEHASVILAARKLGRPVRWVQGRSENLSVMPHGRGQVQWIEMGFDPEGHFTGMRCRLVTDAGAYAGFGGALGMGTTRNMSSGVYRIPVIAFETAVAITNTTPMGAFRGAGRPEAAELLERMMDIAAAQLGIDRIDLRRRNLIPAFETPITTATGWSYDNGDYPMVLDRVLELAGYDDLLAQQAARRESGTRFQLGIGVSVYVEVTAQGGTNELATVNVRPDGSATIRCGTSPHGQGHATSFGMIVSDTLGIPLERIGFVHSDTELIPRGGGTGGSRSLQAGGSAVLRASERLLEHARSLAADELEAAPEDIVVHPGAGLGVAGVPSRTLSWPELVVLAEARQESLGAEGNGSNGSATNGDGPNATPEAREGTVPGLDPVPDLGPLSAVFDYREGDKTFPFGAHVSLVEVDVETGMVRPLRHVALDDCGRIHNPLLVEGQQHGGIAQGMAQVLWEEIVFDDDGNPMTGTLADYEMPSAAEFPSFETASTETPTPRNPLGAKGIGESGTCGGMSSVHNAVVDAVSHLGVRHIAMPCSPSRVWRAIQAAKEGGAEAEGGGRPLWRDHPDIFDRLPDRDLSERPEAADFDV